MASHNDEQMVAMVRELRRRSARREPGGYDVTLWCEHGCRLLSAKRWRPHGVLVDRAKVEFASSWVWHDSFQMRMKRVTDWLIPESDPLRKLDNGRLAIAERIAFVANADELRDMGGTSLPTNERGGFRLACKHAAAPPFWLLGGYLWFAINRCTGDICLAIPEHTENREGNRDRQLTGRPGAMVEGPGAPGWPTGHCAEQRGKDRHKHVICTGQFDEQEHYFANLLRAARKAQAQANNHEDLQANGEELPPRYRPLSIIGRGDPRRTPAPTDIRLTFDLTSNVSARS